MSRSFTVKPAAARTQGRGRGTNQATTTQPGRSTATQTGLGRGTSRSDVTTGSQTGTRDASPQRPPPQPTGLHQRMSHQGAYTMITPNEERRREIRHQAQQEEENYQRHKEQRKLGHVSYTGTVGGGEVTQAEARNKAATQLKTTKIDSIQKRQQYRTDLKGKEDEKYGRHKAEQRRKSDSNAVLEKGRQQKLEEDRRQRNDAFLKRIEAENRAKRVEKLTRNQPSGSEASGGNSLIAENERVSGAECSSSVDTSPDASTESRVRGLQTMFPDCDKDTLKELLLQNDGSVDAVILLLTGE